MSPVIYLKIDCVRGGRGDIQVLYTGSFLILTHTVGIYVNDCTALKIPFSLSVKKSDKKILNGRIRKEKIFKRN
jgi:hypothetical protein